MDPRSSRKALGPALLVAAVGLVAAPASAAGLDLALLLAIDVSRSVDAHEYDLQKNGFAAAFRDRLVLDAVRTAAPNGVSVALMQWSGPGEQDLSVTWTTIRDAASAEVLAARIAAVSRPATSGGTALADALARAVSIMSADSPAASRHVIDVSGDGVDNRDESPAAARDAALSRGIVVNGLAISNEQPYLGGYYRTMVAGGPGAFVVHARNYDDFAEAIRAKLIREIAGPVIGLGPPPAVLPVSAPPGLAASLLPR